MQVYRELRVVTARPTPDEEARVPHALYGIRPAADPGSVAWWHDAALAEMDRAHAGRSAADPYRRQRALFRLADRRYRRHPRSRPGRTHGGTGTAQADRPSSAARPPRRGRSGDRRSASAPPTANASPAPGKCGGAPAPGSPSGRRSRRALPRGASPPSCSTRRGRTSARPSHARLAAMLERGALDEVRALLALGLDPALPAMRAHGVPELAAYLRGDRSASRRQRGGSDLVTGQYTKRQATWFRHHPLAAPSRTHTIHARIGE